MSTKGFAFRVIPHIRFVVTGIAAMVSNSWLAKTRSVKDSRVTLPHLPLVLHFVQLDSVCINDPVSPKA